jgi:hypothetical protein
VYLGSLLHFDLSDYDAEAQLKKVPQASFGALRSKIFSSSDIPGRLMAVLLNGCE